MRALRRLLLVLGVLLVLLLVADRAGAYVATRVVEDRYRAETGAEAQAAVRGFPFLTQALARRLDDVELRAPSAKLRGQDVTVSDVRASARDVQALSGDSARLGSLDASALVPFAEAERAFGLPAGSLRRTPDGRLDLSAAGFSVQLGPEDVRLEGRSLVVDPDLPAFARALVELPLRLDLPGLPEGVVLRDLGVEEDGLRVRATGSGVTVP